MVFMNIQLLENIKEYIEYCEESFSAEYDTAQSKEELIELKKMPDIYYDVLKEIENYSPVNTFVQKQKPLENDFQKVLNDNFWELLL